MEEGLFIISDFGNTRPQPEHGRPGQDVRVCTLSKVDTLRNGSHLCNVKHFNPVSTFMIHVSTFMITFPPIQIVIATPGRLLEILKQEAVKLDAVKTVVVDEVGNRDGYR